MTDLTGRLIRRCSIETRAEPNAEFGALHFDERFVFDDGSPDDVLNWAVRHTEDGAFDAREPSVDGGLWSALEGPCWRLHFKRLAGPPMLYKVRFTQISFNTVLKQVRLQRLGLTLARMDGFHRIA